MFDVLFPGGLYLFAGVVVLLLTFYRWINKRDH
jgi:hypothetical protein